MDENELVINDFCWKVAGAAGDGVLNAGLNMFAKTCLRSNLHVFSAAEYPSLIRGGHNHLDTRVSDRPLFSHTKDVNLLLAMNLESITKHVSKIPAGGGVIYDGESLKTFDPKTLNREDIEFFDIPLMKLAFENGGKILRNTVGIGASFALLHFDLETLNGVIQSNFARKGEKVIDMNIKAAKAGYDYAKEHFSDAKFKYRLKAIEKKENRIFVSGNESIGLGAVKAGCKFYSAYPMTPASSLISIIVSQEKNYDIVVKHTEDEIAAINMAIGASYTGVRAMTGTSGGGFALMTEGFGLASQTETPLVVVEVMRPGPGTGMATHSGQGDLRFLMHASTDEFPRILMAPGDPEECYKYTIDAFNLAEKYQLPVIVMSDKYLGESYFSVPEFNQNVTIDRGETVVSGEAPQNGPEGYLRYKHTDSGVSPRTIPGVKKGMHVASSYEHDEKGMEREEEEIRIAMHKKRFKKLETASKLIPEPELVGPQDADVTVLLWGSTKGPFKEAARMLEKEGKKVNYLQVVFFSPFPKDKVAQVIKQAKKTVVIEGNMTSQFSSVIKEQTGLDIDHKILRYDGRPFNPEDIAAELSSLIDDSKSPEQPHAVAQGV